MGLKKEFTEILKEEAKWSLKAFFTPITVPAKWISNLVKGNDNDVTPS